MKKVIIPIVIVLIIVIAGVAIFMATRPKTRTVSINFAQYNQNVTSEWKAEVKGADNPSVQIIPTGNNKSIVVITYKNPGNYELSLTDVNNETHNYKIIINENGLAKVN